MLLRLHHLVRSIATGLVRRLNPRAGSRMLDDRAFRIYQAIMTETCERCLAPLTVCRRSHGLADRYII